VPQPPHDSSDPPHGSSPAPVLAEVVRSGIVEARHRGSLVLLAPDGSVELALGDADAVVLPRSSVKPLQAAGMVRAGLRLPPEQLALACASHSGEPRHAALCRDVLHEAGLDEDALGCPPSLPLGEAALEAWVREGGRPDRVHHNCSGKHAAMLATCVSCGWPVGGYLDPAHPLQARLRETVEELSGEPVGAVAVDGCGAPAFGMSLPGLARAFARIATGEPEVAGAMRAHPGVVGGVGRDVSELMAAVDGLVAKEGAEGAYAAALPDGRAMALKIDDGAKRPLPGLLAAVLERWGRGGATVERWRETAVLGGGAPVGSVRVAAALG
jgi:L-asparaginase II